MRSPNSKRGGADGKDAPRITRDSLEESLRSLQGDIDREAEPLIVKLAYGAAVTAVVAVGIAYLIGRRAGRERVPLVEIRRI